MAANFIPDSVKEVLEYRPNTGEFIWLVSRGKAKAGNVAGCLNADGYIVITHKRVQYYAHRLAWFLHTGKQPKGLIDHEDNNPSNNAFGNLRESDYVKNGLNLRKGRTKVLGLTFVNNSWRAKITICGKVICLYRGKDFFEACCARKSAENRHHRPLLEDE